MAKRSFWILHEHLCSPDEYQCASCGRNWEESSRFCPFCGAEMKRVKVEPDYVEEYEILDILLDDEDDD